MYSNGIRPRKRAPLSLGGGARTSGARITNLVEHGMVSTVGTLQRNVELIKRIPRRKKMKINQNDLALCNWKAISRLYWWPIIAFPLKTLKIHFQGSGPGKLGGPKQGGLHLKFIVYFLFVALLRLALIFYKPFLHKHMAYKWSIGILRWKYQYWNLNPILSSTSQ